MKTDATLLGGGQSLEYENGFISNHDEEPVIVGKIKKVEYGPFVEAGLILCDKLYNQPRPIKDDSLQHIERICEAVGPMIEWIGK